MVRLRRLLTSAARAFGDYARRLATLPGPPLHATLPHFHDFDRRRRATSGVSIGAVDSPAQQGQLLLEAGDPLAQLVLAPFLEAMAHVGGEPELGEQRVEVPLRPGDQQQQPLHPQRQSAA